MSQFSESVQRHMIGGNNNKPHPSFGAHSWKMAEEAALAPDDAGKILEKLLDAQNKSFMLGLGLNLRLRDIEAIHARYTDPRERLLHIIIAFLREEEPRPTWSVILEALRNPIVSLTAVARRVETALFATAAQPTTSAPVLYPSTLSSQQGIGVSNQDIKHTPALLMAVSPDSPVESPRSSLHTQQGTSHNTTHSALGSSLTTFHQELTSSAPTPVPIPTQAHPHQLASTGDSGSVSTITTSSDEVKQMISELDSKFDTLKNSIRECLEKRGVQVKRVADILTSLSADEDEHHKMFLESHVSVLFKAANVAELFGTMNFHWNYLSPPPLDHLVHKFNLVEVKSQLEAYNSDLLQFRMKTLLTLFCQTQRKKRIRLSPDFHEVVAEFEWTENVTLEDVEQFRQEYASHYNLRECAMMIAEVRPGSFIVTWYVPKSVVEKLKTKVPRPILKQHGVQKLQIAGACVYRIISPSSPPALTSQQSMITLTTDDEEEEEKEPDDIGTSTLETSVRSNNKRSLRPRTYNSSVSSDRGYSSAHSLHRACRTLHSTRTLGVFCPRTLTDTSSNSSSTYPYKSSFKSQRTSFTTVTKFYRVTPKKYLKNSRATSALTVREVMSDDEESMTGSLRRLQISIPLLRNQQQEKGGNDEESMTGSLRRLQISLPHPWDQQQPGKRNVREPDELPCEKVDRAVIRDLSQVLVLWTWPARSLGLEDSDIATIQLDNPGDTREQSYKMLHTWVQRCGQSATYQTLGRVLLTEASGVYPRYVEIVSKYCS